MKTENPRGGVGREDVFQAADKLDADGRKPTLDAVRAVIGRGSYATITQYLREWKKLKEDQPEPESALDELVPERVERLIQGVARQIWMEARSTAEQRLQAEREEVERKQSDMEARHREALDLADLLESQKDKLAEKVAHLLPQVETLEAKVKDAEANTARVQAVLDEARSNHQAQQEKLEAQIQKLQDELTEAHKREAETSGRLQALEALQQKDND